MIVLDAHVLLDKNLSVFLEGQTHRGRRVYGGCRSNAMRRQVLPTAHRQARLAVR